MENKNRQKAGRDTVLGHGFAEVKVEAFDQTSKKGNARQRPLKRFGGGSGGGWFVKRPDYLLVLK
ncbi:MAG: hypothetical protein LC650_04285 [Actinobacteria bacterium]|nr:hypothetical protein [Actinomycetota bacterium]